MRRSIVILALPLLACGSTAQMVLHDPVESNCRSAGMKGCDDLADGVVMYVEGEKTAGYAKVKAAVGKNMDKPEKIARMTDALRLLQKAPGVGGYVAQLRPIIDLLAESSDEAKRLAAAKPKPKKAKADDEDDADAKEAKEAKADAGEKKDEGEVRDVPKRPPPEPPPKVTGNLAGTAMLANNARAKDCRALADAPVRQVGGARCLTVVPGPFLVTDLHLPAGCAHETVVLSGDPEHPHWFIVAPAGQPIGMHGAALFVPQTEELVVAVRPVKGSISGESACAVTWSGVR